LALNRQPLASVLRLSGLAKQHTARYGDDMPKKSLLLFDEIFSLAKGLPPKDKVRLIEQLAHSLQREVKNPPSIPFDQLEGNKKLSQAIRELPDRDFPEGIVSAVFDLMQIPKESRKQPYDIFCRLFPSAAKVAKCPLCTDDEENWRISILISELSREHNWTNTQIADWLEEQDT
jgi:hypothetical protein